MLRIVLFVVVLFASCGYAASSSRDPLNILNVKSASIERNEEEREFEEVKLFERTDLNERTTTTQMTLGTTYSDYVDIYSPTNNQMVYYVDVPSNSKLVLTINSTESMLMYLGNSNSYWYYKQSTILPGLTTLELRVDCSWTSYRIEFQAIWPYYRRSDFTIVANAESNEITYGSVVSAEFTTFKDAFFVLGFQNQCNPVSILISAPTNGISNVILQRSCSGAKKRSVEEKRQSTCPLVNAIGSTQQPFYSSQTTANGMSYYLIETDSCVMSGAVLKIRSLDDENVKPYTIRVSSQTKSVCPDSCNGNGACFEGTCYCQKGYSGSSCNVFQPTGFTQVFPGTTYSSSLKSNSSMAFFYSNFTKSQVNGRNLQISIHGVLSIQIFNRVQRDSNIMLQTGVYTFDQPSVWEFCSAGVEGVVIYTVHYIGQESNFNFTLTFVDRTLAINAGPTTTQFYSQYNSYRALMFRVDGSNINNQTTIYATTEGRGLYQTVLTSGLVCAFWNYRTVGSSTTNYDYGMDKNAYQVSGTVASAINCRTDDPFVLKSDDLFLIISFQNANMTTVQIHDNVGSCPNNCSNAGRCGGNNQCVCVTGFTGNDCSIPTATQLFVDQPEIVQQLNRDVVHIYYNPVNEPFVVSVNVTGFVNVQVYRPLSQSNYGQYTPVCSSTGDHSGWWMVLVGAYMPVEIVVRSLDTDSVYNVLTTETTSESYPGARSLSLKDFEILDGEKITISIDLPTDFLYSTSLTITDKSFCNTLGQFMPQMTSTGYSIVVDACQRGSYMFKVDASESIEFNYTITKENVQTCPNCCSKNGVCNAGVCTCTQGYGGPSCSEEITCVSRPNICGYTQGFTISPLVMQQYQPYGCSIDDVINYLTYAINLQPNTSSCDELYRKTVCDIYFVTCTNTSIADGCIENCHKLADECRCSHGVERSTCDQIEQIYFAPFAYFETTPSCGRPPLTTQPLTTQELTTSPLTTQELTTKDITTQPLTSQAVTSQPLTTQALTSKSLTTSAVTSNRLTTSQSPVTTRAVTTKSLTTGVSSSSGTVTTSFSVAAVCSTYTYSGQGYFCTADGKGYYQCLEGAFLSQSAYRPCPVGTSCKCAQGVDCGTLGLCSTN